jgi:hypothetical protein
MMLVGWAVVEVAVDVSAGRDGVSATGFEGSAGAAAKAGVADMAAVATG